MVTDMINVENILKNYNIDGKYINAENYGSGHINDTILVRYKKNEKINKYILRKINNFVFKEPKLIIENTVNVTDHIRKKLNKGGLLNSKEKVLTLIENNNGEPFYILENNYWCLFEFVENAYTVDNVDTEQQAYAAAKAYGKFQNYLSDFDVEKCHITIEGFHNLSNRIKYLEEVIQNDPKKRLKNVHKEIKQLESYYYIKTEFDKLEHKDLPIRITHNDTKINNIMLDTETNEGICVIDLDTVMPGIILNDFGDMVRTFTSPALEDEKDFSKVEMRLTIFKALVEGYLEVTFNFLTEDEINNLVLGSKIILLEQAIRFLADYLAGDVYYKIDYEEHNLNRAKNQFSLLASIESQSNEMEEIIKKFTGEYKLNNEKAILQ